MSRRNPQNTNPRNSNQPADGWRLLAAQAQRAAPLIPTAPPAGFVERVLADRATDGVRLARQDDERLVAWAGCLALAASLVLVLWNWPELEFAWTGPPSISDAWVQAEPWL
jgi:hypothetical protein